MTSQNDRIAVYNIRVSAFDLYFTKANGGLCVFLVVRVGGGEGVLIPHTAMQ